MRLVIFFINNIIHFFFLSILLNLLGQVCEIITVVFLKHKLIVVGDYILLFLLPIKLLTFKLSDFFDLLAFTLESCSCLVIDSLNVTNVVLTFGLCMVINSKRPGWFKEWWVSFRMEVWRNCFPFKG